MKKNYFLCFLLGLGLLFSYSVFSQKVHSGKIRGVAFTDDGKMMASVSSTDGRVMLWRLPALTRIYSGEHFWLLEEGMDNLSFNKEGTWLLGGNREAVAFSIKEKKEYDLPFDADNVHFSCDDKAAVCVKLDGKSAASIFKVLLNAPKTIPQEPELKVKFKGGEYSRLLIKEFLPDQYVFMSGYSPVIYFQKKGSGKPYAEIKLPEGSSQLFKLSADRKYLLTDNKGEVYDISSGMPQKIASLAGTDVSKEEKKINISGDKIYAYDNYSIKTFAITSGKLEKDEVFEKSKDKKHYWDIYLSNHGKYLALVDWEPHNLRLFESGQKEYSILNESIFYSVNYYVRQKNKDSVIAILKKCLVSDNKPNLNLIAHDSLFLFLKDTPEWKELLSKDWYSPYEKLVLEGDQLFSDGKMEEAYAVYSRAIALDSLQQKAFEGRAGALVQLKKMQEAEKDCNVCLGINSKNLNCLLIRSDVSSRLGKSEKEVNDYIRILSLDHTRTDLYLAIAQRSVYSDKQRAYKYINEYLDRVTNNGDAYIVQGDIAIQMGEKEHAANYYKKALQYNVSPAYYKKALDLFMEQGNHNSANGLVNIWLEKDPGNSTALEYQRKIRDIQYGTTAGTDLTACSACKGSGWESAEGVCSACRGRGGSPCTSCGGRRFTYNIYGQSSYCNSCRGEGFTRCYKCYGTKSQKAKAPCKACSGKGKK